MKRALALLLFVFAGNLAAAHEMTMAEMELREARPGEFLWQWTVSGNKPPADELTPSWPESCAADASVVRCGKEGLNGVLTMEGVGRSYSAALVKVFWRDGQSRVYTLTERQPSVHLYGSADDQRGMGEVARAYLVLGVEHILSGIDHLMFVAALLFLVGFQRKLVWTITAFTLAHSITLASAALGWLTLRSAPVEASIALSIVLVAAEALHRRETVARRLPALVAFLFGLVHGLGFAGALSEIGLPQAHLATALLTFNLGVEIGQLMAVAAAWAAWQAFRRLKFRQWQLADYSRVPLLYGIGSLAAYWSLSRIVTLINWQS
ncbi:MAG: HupE/UreJ family protein [Pseudomonadota bacterium]